MNDQPRRLADQVADAYKLASDIFAGLTSDPRHSQLLDELMSIGTGAEAIESAIGGPDPAAAARVARETRIRRFDLGAGLFFYRTGARWAAIRLLESLERDHSRTIAYFDACRDARKKGLSRPPQLENRGNPFALHDSIVLYAALAVEGFLNLYGTVRLGEAFFKQYVERLNTDVKLAALVGTCVGHLLAKDAEILTVQRRLFEQRGALVHPKTREPKSIADIPRGLAVNRYELQDARRAVAHMVRFFELMGEIDPDVRTWVANEDAEDF